MKEKVKFEEKTESFEEVYSGHRSSRYRWRICRIFWNRIE